MPRAKNPRRTNKYSQEFKSKAVQLSLLKGIEVQDVARTLDIHPFMLSRWRKEYREGKIKLDKRKKVVKLPKDRKKMDRIKHLEKEVARLKLENDLLKKWQRFLGEERRQDIASSRETKDKD